jgi:hypothetical protein
METLWAPVSIVLDSNVDVNSFSYFMRQQKEKLGQTQNLKMIVK